MNFRKLYESIMRNIGTSIHSVLNEMAIDKNIFRKFDTIDVFSGKYIKVSKKGKFNLINGDGELFNNVWFDSIDIMPNGSVITTNALKNGRTMIKTYKDVNTFLGSPIIMEAASNTDIIKNIIDIVSIDNISVVSTFDFTISDGTSVTIIAKVNYKDMPFYLSEDAKLYKMDGNEYVIAKAYNRLSKFDFTITTFDILKKMLKNGYVEFIFTKKDGTTRIAYGTLLTDELNRQMGNTGKVMGTKPGFFAFFDVENNAWRGISYQKDQAKIVIVEIFDSVDNIDMLKKDDERVLREYNKLIEKMNQDNSNEQLITTTIQ